MAGPRVAAFLVAWNSLSTKDRVTAQELLEGLFASEEMLEGHRGNDIFGGT
jgi:hypothetical protein